jgi:hypothetical protein
MNVLSKRPRLVTLFGWGWFRVHPSTIPGKTSVSTALFRLPKGVSGDQTGEKEFMRGARMIRRMEMTGVFCSAPCRIDANPFDLRLAMPVDSKLYIC